MRMRLLGRCFLASRCAWTVLAITIASAPGCFVTIADPAVDSTGGRPTAGAGGGAHSGGTTASGGAGSDAAAGAGAGGTRGDAGIKVCGVCALAHVKTHGCSDGGCMIVECESGFVDCDGRPDNGCEIDFHVETGDAMSGAVAAKLTPELDGDGAEWSGLRAYSMRLPCTDCLGTQPGGQNGERILGEPADSTDLNATFRVAWDEAALYVFAQVHDDQIVAWEASNLERQDGVELLLNGDLNDVNNQYSPDVHHLFVGALAPANANVVERNQQLQAGDTRAATQVAARCYSVEMSLSWPYVMGRVPHTPVAGELHGFTIAVNDWDSPPLTSDPPVRQTQYFWVVPGKNYSYETTGFGVVTLE
jgi:hypothetical protein